MSPPDSDPVRIERAAAADLPMALWLVFAGLDDHSRAAQAMTALREIEDNPSKGEALFVARRGKRVAGAAWGSVLPGRIAQVLPPQMIDGESDAVGDTLLLAVHEYLAATDVRLAQVELNFDTTTDADRLAAAGYVHAADLVYLAWDCLTAFEAPAESPLQFVPYEPSHYQRLVDVVQRSYLDTRDCPMLNDVRSVTDVLAGYLHTASAAVPVWFLVQVDKQDVGCLLLADHVADQQYELVYVGLAPEARGRGWGLQMARFGQSLAAAAKRERFVLAVDAANHPARAIYSAAGFQEWLRRRIWVREF